MTGTVALVDMLHDCETKLRQVAEACKSFETPQDTVFFLRHKAERLAGDFAYEADHLTRYIGVDDA